jgi:acyl-homoserine lactone acylase PvdQ
MFKDYLYPLMTFLRKNIVVVAPQKLTKLGQPILVQSLETHNYLPKMFEPVVLKVGDTPAVFAYTLPGLPLLFAGSTPTLAWSFTGVLVDRTNIEQIETVGSKFYHHDTE